MTKMVILLYIIGYGLALFYNTYPPKLSFNVLWNFFGEVMPVHCISILCSHRTAVTSARKKTKHPWMLLTL